MLRAYMMYKKKIFDRLDVDSNQAYKWRVVSKGTKSSITTWLITWDIK